MADDTSSDLAPPLASGEADGGFPVVGIGASAGGLRAYQTFFSALPPEPGMAFVLIQHLSPDHESALAELVQTQTRMSVAQVGDHPAVEANRVYVIPPGKHLVIEGGSLALKEPGPGRGKPSTIDHFFRSLAEDMGERAVCIVLSGTGSDGALGLKAVKERAGLTMAQDPDDADYDGMPRSAVATGLVDVVGSAAELAQMLVRVRHSAREIVIPAQDDDETTALQSVLTLLRQRTGHDFSDYKPSTIRRRLARRLQVNGIPALSEYLAFLRTHPAEVQALLRDFLISVTQFFRDPDAFDVLEREVVPKLFEGKGRGDTVRVWVAGCATGEEAYSVAMLLCEHRDRLGVQPEIQVFATDIDDDALASAREGLYPEAAIGDLTRERLLAFFDEEPNGIRVKGGLRDMVLFARHNLISDPPFSRLDLVSCRNVLIYLNRSIQRRVFTAFHYALAPDGYLFIGGSEGADVLSKGFAELDKSARVFRRRDANLGGDRFELFSGTRTKTPRPPRPSVPADAESGLVDRYASWTLQAYAPPRVLVDEHHEITHVFGGAGEYLRDREGPVSNNVVEKVLRAFRVDLRSALFRAFSKGEATDTGFHGVSVGGTERVVRLHVGMAGGEAEADGLAEVVFVELDPASVEGLRVGVIDRGDGEQLHDDPAVVRMEEELRRTRERLQAIVEEQETSNEELKASNEELQSMNEELQSTTEELETSREELQSMNEELHTVNQELKTKVEELTRANADLHNLIASTAIATLFLDRELRVSRYTPVAADLFNLIPGDVGRPFDHVTHRLDHDGLTTLAQRVLDTLHVEEQEVEDDSGRWYVLRATPYRTADDRIEGVVMTVFDVTLQKRAQAEALRRARQQEALAELGQLALRTGSLADVFDRAVALAVDALDADFAKVLRHDPEAGVLHLVSGVGWAEGIVGHATVPDDEGSQAGYTLVADRPVVVPDLAKESRFSAPTLLSDHDVRSGISVTIPGPGARPFGVFGVHAREVRQYSEADTQFIDALASVVGAAIRRDRDEATIRHQLGEIEAIYATAPVGLGVLDADLRYRRINERLAAINGTSVEDHLGKRPGEVVPSVAPDLEPKLRRVIETGEALEEFEIRGTTPGSQEERIWLTTYVPRFGSDGEVLGVSAMVRDVTERRRQETDLAEANRLLELAMSGGGLGGYTLEFGDGEPIVHFDEQAQALLETPPTATRRAINERVHPDDLAEARAKVDRACDPDGDSDTFSIEFRYPRPDGRTVWLAARGVCLFSDGAPRRVVGLLFDITDLKEAEARARRQLAQVDAYFDAVPLGVAVYDADGRYLRANRQLAALVGREPEALLGHRPGDLFPGHRDINEPFLQRVLQTGVPIRDVEMALPAPSDPDGPLRDWLVNFVPLTEDGEVMGAMVVIQDVTALKRAQAGLERLTTELEARVVMRTAEVRRLVGDLTEAERRERGRVAQVLHDDLQQLLYATQFKLQAMRRGAEAELLEIIEDADGLVARAVQVTRTLTVDLRPPVLRGEGLDRTFEWLAHRMGEAYGLDVAVKREGPVQAGKTVQVLLFQIVRELLFNVVKHAGTSEATIRVGPADGGRVRVVVSDDGVGFEADGEAEEATGVGLVGVRERIRLVGGSVDVRSAPDSGTVIEIVCPTEL
ncbi:PAS domain-containing protein [Rubrivirga marina]|uniref:protein-glutamate O-methyltransferase n=1 Tax=Rubrivirga marina TaxID=1196024 RepID=A0A271J1M5_9BACT|nr:PAS domain-containing protein [Rubrivirga marina]PAP76944.1 hypothetical protein BSZ37_11130 [Rubrivirga marina]